ncbi:MAG: EF-Tu/IF-2/RF-3 family GTPase, partial [Candidatus Micrarchaeia archaeon]
KWAVSSPIMKQKGISFNEIYESCSKNQHADLQEKAPLGDVILEMVVNHLPNPLESQKYRIPVIWHGDADSPEGKTMINCDETGKTCFMITAIQMDEHAGEVAVGRVYSGTIKKGSELYLASTLKTEKVQQVAVYMGPDRVLVDEVPAGNIVALVGLKDVYAGETASEGEIHPFEKIKHHAEPVVTKSIEAKNPRDLVKLIEVLRKIGKEDPTIKITINQDTGEHLMSGMGELHLEIIEYKIKNERGVDITSSPPIVLYVETVTGKGPELEGKSPNKHNKFKIIVEPLEESVQKALEDGKISDTMKGKELATAFLDAGLPREESKNIMKVEGNNLFLDMSKGVQYLQDIKELLNQAFKEAVREGPLAKEKCKGVKVKLTDATIHTDPAHRGPAQIIPAVKRPIYAGMLHANTVLLEPKQKLVVTSPAEYMSGIISQIQGRRGQVGDIQQDGESIIVNSIVPVSTMFGFASDIRGATQGRAAWYYEYHGYDKVPTNLQEPTIASIRKRKGEPENRPTAKDFLE